MKTIGNYVFSILVILGIFTGFYIGHTVRMDKSITISGMHYEIINGNPVNVTRDSLYCKMLLERNPVKPTAQISDKTHYYSKVTGQIEPKDEITYQKVNGKIIPVYGKYN